MSAARTDTPTSGPRRPRATPAAAPAVTAASPSTSGSTPAPTAAAGTSPTSDAKRQPTLGSIFAGIGGLDLGFERAGFRTAWQVEINEANRTVLGDRFPDAARHRDVREVGAAQLEGVDCIAAGFPCQDISGAGNHLGGAPGLAGERSGLFWEAVRIVGELRPRWVVLENVERLLSIHDGRDFAAVVGALAERGYVGLWRVLDAQHFGVPQRRRRVFLVAGDNERPPGSLLSDAAPVEGLPSSLGSFAQPLDADAWVGNTLLTQKARCQIGLGSELLIAVEDGWDQMVERARISELLGVPAGVDDVDRAMRFAAGNAIVPQVAEWIAAKLMETF